MTLRAEKKISCPISPSHRYFSAADGSQFSWASLEAGLLEAPYRPPEPDGKLGVSNFTPDKDAAAYEETRFAGDQELFAGWSDLDRDDGTYFAPADVHLGPSAAAGGE